ncbi:MAG: lactonase family protein [Bacteroidetes bacterium]|nr:lactonase family protein [Bacteroidota bacterium]
MQKNWYPSLIGALLLTLGMLACASEQTQEEEEPSTTQTDRYWKILVGTYTKKEGHVDGKGEGVYLLSMDPDNGSLKTLSQSPPLISPSFLDIHPDMPIVYTVNEHGEGESATLTALKLNMEDNQMEILNQVPSRGLYPCHINVAPGGKSLIAANYVGGSIISYQLESDGRIGTEASFIEHTGTGPNPDRQEAPHAHMVKPYNNGQSLLAVDLGSDQIFHYDFDPESGLLQASGFTAPSEAGAGPRHIDFHPNKDIMYLVNELNGIIDVYKKETNSRVWQRIQSIPLTTVDKGPMAGAAIHVHPNGRFLYASNRGNYNSISQYNIDSETGKLEKTGEIGSGGKTPRSFVISPDGNYLLVANQDSGYIQVFEIAPETGALNKAYEPFWTPTPVCLTFVPNYK